MMSQRKSDKTGQAGGALVEGLLISGVLVTFMIGIPMMGTLVDLKQTTIQASRYAAWEKTVQKNSMPIHDQVDARFFKNDSAPIRTIEPGNDLLGTNYLWGELRTTAPPNAAPGNNGDGAVISRDNLPLHERARVTALTSGVRTWISEAGAPQGNQYPTTLIPGPAGSKVYEEVGGAVAKIGQFIGKNAWDTPDKFNPGDGGVYINGLMRSQVEVVVENNELMNMASDTCLQQGAGCVFGSTSILIDGWSAADNDTIRGRIHGFVPSARLEKVGELVSKVKVVPMLKDLGNLEKAFGCVKLGVRPSKDLRAYPTNTPTEGDDC